MGDEREQIKMRHSFCIPTQTSHIMSDKYCKSDFDVPQQRQLCRNRANLQRLNESLGQYYKKYEHDEVPVKDLTFETFNIGDSRKGSLTNSELDKLEMKIFKNISQELQTDNNNSITSLESNIKFFKTTVQEIFDNFYASMRDFEAYKKRFHDILAKNQVEAVADMEDFIKDMIQHIMSSESSLSNDSKKSGEEKSASTNKIDDYSSLDIKDDESLAKIERNLEETVTLETANTNSVSGSVQPFVNFKNDGYFTDSTREEAKTLKSMSAKEEIFNIYLLSGNPCVQIKMNERNLLSEINIKDPSKSIVDSKYVASAENMKRLADKKMELEKYVDQETTYNDGPDREIPVKVSYAKKNIHLNEDFSHDRECEKSFISKLCSFLCRKFRKS